MWGKTLFAKSVFPHTPFHKKLLYAIPAIADAIPGNRHFVFNGTGISKKLILSEKIHFFCKKMSF